MFKFVLLLFLPLIAVAGPRIAVFDEPGFPNASTRDADWYVGVVENAQRVNLNTIGFLEAFDVIIFPHGGFMPRQAEKAIGALMARGGTVIVAGEMQTPIGYDADIAEKAREMEKKRWRGLYCLSEKIWHRCWGVRQFS